MLTQHCSSIMYKTDFNPELDFTVSLVFNQNTYNLISSENYGFSIFFVDGSLSTLTGGASGYGLGVVNATTLSTVSGLFLAIGFDDAGYFSLSGLPTGFTSGNQFVSPKTISIRKDGTNLTFLSAVNPDNIDFFNLNQDVTLRVSVRKMFQEIQIHQLLNGIYKQVTSFDTGINRDSLPKLMKFGVSYSGDTFFTAKDITVNYSVPASPTPTPSFTPTNTPTTTPTPTNTITPTITPTFTPTNTETPTGTPTETSTPTPTATFNTTPTPTPTETPPEPTVTPTSSGPATTPTTTPSSTPSCTYYDIDAVYVFDENNYQINAAWQYCDGSSGFIINAQPTPWSSGIFCAITGQVTINDGLGVLNTGVTCSLPGVTPSPTPTSSGPGATPTASPTSVTPTPTPTESCTSYNIDAVYVPDTNTYDIDAAVQYCDRTSGVILGSQPTPWNSGTFCAVTGQVTINGGLGTVNTIASCTAPGVTPTPTPTYTPPATPAAATPTPTPTFTPGLPSVNITDQYQETPSNFAAGYSLNSTGDAQLGTGATWTNIPGEWLVSGTAGSCEMTWSVDSNTGSGSFTQPGTAGIYYPLNSTRTWQVLAAVGDIKTVVFTVTIRDISTQIVLDTAQITLTNDRS